MAESPLSSDLLRDPFQCFRWHPGRTLVGNLASIGFSDFPGGNLLFWVYQLLAVLLLAGASMTAFQDAQATEWRDVAIGEIPEMIVYRDPRGTFTRSVTITFGWPCSSCCWCAEKPRWPVPYYGVGVFMPIMVMGLAIRQHFSSTSPVRRVPGEPSELPLQRFCPGWFSSGRSPANGRKAAGWC